MDLWSNLSQWLLAASGAEGHGAHAAGALTAQPVHDVSYLWLIPLFPLVGAIVNAAIGARMQKRMGERFVHGVAVGAMVLSFLVAVVAFVQLLGMEPGHRFLRDHLWTMLSAGPLVADLSFSLDPLSMMMTLIITFIGGAIHIYSIGYMHGDAGYWRFFSYLNLFVFSMLLLVMGDNFALMFFGWEGVGLCSYLLIGFWYEDVEKAQAGVKAFVTNRFGDFGFVLGLFLLFWALGGGWSERQDYIPEYQQNWVQADPNYEPQAQTGTVYARESLGEHGGVKHGITLNFRELRDQVAAEGTVMKQRLEGMTFFGMPVITLALILMFFGATAKSAQIPLYVWLPDAMAGPTPVSALIHAATMVTAGVYMVARLNFLFVLSPLAMTVVAVIGVATALFAATIGIVQYDIKKVLAYSTVSQLGFMFIGVGVGAYWAGVYHLLTHAFFKATLFLSSGSVILGCHHEQDMRKMGGLAKFMPTTRKAYLYATIAISGFPIANGFFSKDEILWKAFDSGTNLLDPTWGKAVWLVGWFTAMLTSFYMWRSYYMTFTGEYRGGGAHAHGHDDHAAAPALATHSVGAAHASTFDADVKHAANHAHGADGDAAKLVHVDHPDHKAEGAHGHGGLPHESPRSITWVLATLAIGCGVTLFLGFWPAVGHLLHVDWMTVPLLERWLEPTFAPAAGAVAARAANSGAVWEWVLIFASVGVATVGWLAARALYKDNKSPIPARVMATFPRVHAFVYAKYKVDELYQATVLDGSMLLARISDWFDAKIIDGAVNAAAVVGRVVANIDGAIDTYVVDGAVNGVANLSLRGGRLLRRIQTGRIQHYLYAALAGALLVIGINYLVR